MKLEQKVITYKGFGKCLELKNGFLRLVVSLDFGPRVLSFSSEEAENIFLEDDKLKFFITSPETEEIYGKNIFYLRGGHRMWVAPESWHTYYPDNDEIKYEIYDNVVIFRQPPQDHNTVEQVLEIKFRGKNSVSVKQIIKNIASVSKLMAPWSISVFEGPGLEIIPMPEKDNGFIPQRHISFWSFGAKITDERLYIGDRFSALRFRKDRFKPLKIGFRVPDGFTLYMTRKSVFVKYFVFDDKIAYPDNNVNYETYTNGKILEMETVGEIKTLSPNETISHEETWSIYHNDFSIPKIFNEDQMEEIVKAYINEE